MRRGEEVTAFRADGLHWPQRLSKLPVEVAYRRSRRLTYDDAVARAKSVNYHHWRVEDPDTGATISSAATDLTEAASADERSKDA